jgi:hypothetical protein
VEGHRAAWLALGGVLLTAGLGTPVTVWTVIALNPQIGQPVWLYVVAAASFGLGLYVLGAVAYGWPLPARPSAVSIPVAGTIPLLAPTEYQVRALRQVVRKVAETTLELHYGLLDAVLKSHPRDGVDPVYEPLQAMTCDEGLAELVRLGELETMPGDRLYHYRITAKGARLGRRPRFRRSTGP